MVIHDLGYYNIIFRLIENDESQQWYEYRRNDRNAVCQMADEAEENIYSNII